MKYLLIGGGPACVAAASTLRRLDGSCEITILAKEPYKPYAKMALPYLISGEAEEERLYLAEPENVTILLGHEVARIHADKNMVETASGDRFPYDRLLIGTGGVPERLRIDGGDLPFVFTIRDLADATGIRSILKDKKGRAIIAGAGPVSMETGDALHKLGLDITFVISSNRVFSTLMDTETARFVEERLLEKGIEIRKGEDIQRIEEDGTVHFRSGDTRLSSLVIVGKGVKPCMHFLEGSGIKTGAGIIVDEHQETSIPGIFAAGDVAETFDTVYEEPRVNALWPAAEEQGKVAALNMASIPATCPGSMARNILRVFGVSILSAGMARADGPEVLRSQGRGYHRKIVLDNGILKGLVFIGDVRNEGLYLSLMKRRCDVTKYAGSILKGTFSYPRFLHSAMTGKNHEI
ncbi:MAG TPA: FAD-dependent oxidoreductase [Deltaproteobacteria bacterium]|nr:FAD-dependent oxidoreductase [Deltaproteobacteria bacterium]